eukprot:11200930-Lingulodinium_polyedra.AAC.1
MVESNMRVRGRAAQFLASDTRSCLPVATAPMPSAWPTAARNSPSVEPAFSQSTCTDRSGRS